MMGQLPPAQNALFYDFCLEEFVAEDHLLRRIDPLLDFSIQITTNQAVGGSNPSGRAI
jgi:hypothetical protein